MDFKSGFVAVIGRPNVGKSTIINEFMGQKLTITSPKPQTTRHRIHAIDTTKDYQIVFVDKTSQKNIVIGKNGEMLKRIGTEARKSIEGFLEKKVFLQLWVKVSAGWSDDKKSLSSLGYD